MPVPDQLATVYATDESLAIRCSGDFAVLCPDWQSMAKGTDGVFDISTPWVLSSATVDFESAGVAANQVVQLTAPKSAFRGGGDLLAVESVSGGTLTLRRLGQDVGVGFPPGLGGVTLVAFTIATLDPQIEEASFELNRRFNIDPAVSGRAPSDVYDLRDLRRATILTVMRDRYAAETRTDRGDFPRKSAQANQELTDVLGRLTIRWGPVASSEQVTTFASMRIER